MSGSKESSQRARDTNIERYGKDYYKVIGAMGGKNGHTGGFASDVVGEDGLTGRERASVAGIKGGRRGRVLSAKNREILEHIKDIRPEDQRWQALQ